MSMNNNHVRAYQFLIFVPAVYVCAGIAIFELFLKQIQAVTNNVNNCVIENSYLDFR
jgi:hypothetical protein